MKKILLTGGTGFIGSYVVEQLLDKDYKLMLTRRHTSDLFRCTSFIDKVEWINTDEDKWIDRAKEFAPVTIINLAWSGVKADERVLWNRQVDNLKFQQDLLEIANESGTKNFIGAGSQAEYGEINTRVNELYPPNPNTAYGAIKLAALTILRSYCSIHDIKWIWFRIFPCFGEREGENWLIPSLVKKIMTDQSMDLTAGEQKYAYLYIEEVARVISSAVDTNVESGIFNISSENPISLKELVENIKDNLRPDFNLNFGALPYRKGQSMYIAGDNAKVCNKIYKIDSSSFEEKLKKTINYYSHLYERK